MNSLCFLAGCIFACTHSFYPLLLLALLFYLGAHPQIVLWFLAAIVWVVLHNWIYKDSNMPDMAVIPNAIVEGVVESIPANADSKTQFMFHLQRLDNQIVSARIMLACYDDCPDFIAGQHWLLTVKMKKPKNLGNPAHFNYREMLLARHIHWTGYIKSGKRALVAAQSNYSPVLKVRQALAKNLENVLPAGEVLGIMEALTLGITSHIDKPYWDLFRRTGTTHLMVISGAHIGLVAGLFFLLLQWLWTLSNRLCLYIPTMQAASVGAFFSAVGYSLLAGFAVPAQRALIACLVMLLRHFTSHRFNGWQAWRYALLTVLLMEPHAVLLSGFYLSFLAVALLIAASRRFVSKGWKKSLILQMVCLFGLMPFTLYWFSYGALNSLFANLIAIPLVSYLIVPISLMSLFLVQLSGQSWILYPIIVLVKGLVFFLKKIDALALMNFTYVMPDIACLFALMFGIALLFFAPKKSCIYLAVLLIFCGFMPAYPRINQGDFHLDVLDVGQGLSVVVKTAKHVLVYDTGMKFYQGNDMGQMALIPYLAITGIKHVDKVVISHPDMDHRGGLFSLEEKFRIDELLVDNIDFYHRGENCHERQPWDWDGVHFRFLPVKQTFRDKNNSSCVLQISNSAGKALLTGDIEQLAEYYLLAMYKQELQSDLLIIAHHGSKTSSTDRFIKQVIPNYAIISSGFDNRYHFPHPQTLKTLNHYQVKVFNTMDCGMLTTKFIHDKPLSSPLPYTECGG